MAKKVGILVVILLLLTESGGWAAETVISQIACGDSHTLVLKNDGTVWAWGSNRYRQLASNEYFQSSTPVHIRSLEEEDICSLAAGKGHNVVLLRNGTALAWGMNDRSQLGIGPPTAVPEMVPTPVRDYTGLSVGIVSISAGDSHTLFRKDDGTVWYTGAITGLSPSSYLQPVPGLTGVDAVTAGSHQMFALQAGKVLSLGANGHGQLGDGSQADRSVPAYVRGPGDSEYLTEVIQVAAGFDHTLALRQDGSVWAWGSSEHGVLGNGEGQSGQDYLTPVRVLGPGGAGYLGDITQIAARGDTSLALDSQGQAYIWGKDAVGQDCHSEYPIPIITNVAGISCGAGFRVLLKKNGLLYAWGSNEEEQTGVADASLYCSSPAVNLMSPLLGDADGDLQITVRDLIALTAHYGKIDPRYDINEDGVIDLYDLVVLAKQISD